MSSIPNQGPDSISKCHLTNWNAEIKYLTIGSCLVPSHYLNQWWLVVDWMLGNKSQWNVQSSSLWWCHQMDAFFRVTDHLCEEFTRHRWIPRNKASDAELALMFSLICAWINSLVNNREAGDLRRHRASMGIDERPNIFRPKIVSRV